jgi:hypothetical protein
VPPDRSDAATATGTRLDVSTNESALMVERLSKRFGTHVAAFEGDYGELFGFLGPIGAGKTAAVRNISRCASRANCGRNCGTWSQLPQSSSVSDRSRRSLAIGVCGQGVGFFLKFWHSTLMRAKTEFKNEGWSIGDSNPGPLACQARAATFSFGVLRLKSARLGPSRTALCRSICGPDCGPA